MGCQSSVHVVLPQVWDKEEVQAKDEQWVSLMKNLDHFVKLRKINERDRWLGENILRHWISLKVFGSSGVNDEDVEQAALEEAFNEGKGRGKGKDTEEGEGKAGKQPVLLVAKSAVVERRQHTQPKPRPGSVVPEHVLAAAARRATAAVASAAAVPEHLLKAAAKRATARKSCPPPAPQVQPLPPPQAPRPAAPRPPSYPPPPRPQQTPPPAPPPLPTSVLPPPRPPLSRSRSRSARRSRRRLPLAPPPMPRTPRSPTRSGKGKGKVRPQSEQQEEDEDEDSIPGWCVNCKCLRRDCFRLGDWLCSECGNHMYAKRTHCTNPRCTAYHSASSSSGVRVFSSGVRESSSALSSSAAATSSSAAGRRSQHPMAYVPVGWCKGCGKPRIECFKQFDWACPECGNHNWARKQARTIDL